jgi:hypothetical protein
MLIIYAQIKNYFFVGLTPELACFPQADSGVMHFRAQKNFKKKK